MTKRHLIVFLNVLGAALLCSLPHWASWLANKGDYTPFSVDPSVSESIYDESHYYATGPRRFMVTGSLDAELDTYELRHLRSGAPTLHSVLIGGGARLLGSVEAAWALSDAVFPALLWLLIYVWAGAATDSILLRTAAAWGTLVFPMGPRNSLLLGWASLIQPLEITRTSQPELSFPVLLLAAYLAYRALCNSSLKYAVAAGVLAGVEFYGYYYYWVALYSGLGVLALVCAAQRKWCAVRQISVIIAVGALVGIRFFYLAVSKDGDDQLARFNIRGAGVNSVGLLLLCITAWALFALLRRIDGSTADRFRWTAAALLTLLVGGCIGLNFHLITGLNLQHTSHFSNRLLQPIGFLLICLATMAWLHRNGHSKATWVRVAAGVALAGSLFVGFYRHYQVSVRTHDAHRLSSPAMQLLIWIREHVPPLEVIGTVDEEISLLLPTVTPQWGFVPVQMRSMASNQEIAFRYWVLSKIIGTPQPVVLYVLSGERYRTGASGIGLPRPVYPVAPILHVTETLSAWEQMDITRALKDRRLDYVVAPVDASRQRIERYLKVQSVYRNDRWELLKVLP